MRNVWVVTVNIGRQVMISKREQRKQEKLLAAIANITGSNLEDITKAANDSTLYSKEESYYEGQAVLNFFKARIKPYVEKGESIVEFDKRYKEWRIKTCEGCGEQFAYALNYDGVTFCSLDCLDAGLNKIGLQITRGRDMKKRWGYFFHPAVVPSSAFNNLKNIYADSAPGAFE